MTEPLNDDELAQAAAGLPGWRESGGRLVREIDVSEADADLLAGTLNSAAKERHTTVDLRVSADTVTITLGPGASAHDVALAAELEAVITGSAPTPGAIDR